MVVIFVEVAVSLALAGLSTDRAKVSVQIGVETYFFFFGLVFNFFFSIRHCVVNTNELVLGSLGVLRSNFLAVNP